MATRCARPGGWFPDGFERNRQSQPGGFIGNRLSCQPKVRDRVQSCSCAHEHASDVWTAGRARFAGGHLLAFLTSRNSHICPEVVATIWVQRWDQDVPGTKPSAGSSEIRLPIHPFVFHVANFARSITSDPRGGAVRGRLGDCWGTHPDGGCGRWPLCGGWRARCQVTVIDLSWHIEFARCIGGEGLDITRGRIRQRFGTNHAPFDGHLHGEGATSTDGPRADGGNLVDSWSCLAPVFVLARSSQSESFYWRSLPPSTFFI